MNCLQGVLKHSKKWIIFSLLFCTGIINCQGELQDDVHSFSPNHRWCCKLYLYFFLSGKKILKIKIA